MAKENPTINERVLILENKDERRDAHYVKLNAKIDELTKSQTQIIELLAGTDLNDKKGFIKLVNKIEEKVNALELQNADHTRDLSQVKFWGRGTAGVVFVSLGLMVKKLFHL